MCTVHAVKSVIYVGFKVYKSGGDQFIIRKTGLPATSERLLPTFRAVG